MLKLSTLQWSSPKIISQRTSDILCITLFVLTLEFDRDVGNCKVPINNVKKLEPTVHTGLLLKIMLKYGSNGPSCLGKPLKRILEEGEIGLLRPIS